MDSRLAVSFGKVADRERKHPGEEASRHLSASGKEASGIRGAQAESRPGVPWPIHCSGPVGFRAWSHWALGLGRLAKETELGPMVPTIPDSVNRTMPTLNPQVVG